MIVEGIPFGTVGEAFRFSVAGYLRASIRITADSASAGTIHIRRAWGSNIVAAYSPAQTIQVNGSEPVDLVVDDCSELVVWVTAAGSGTFDLEYTLDTPAIDALSAVYATMGRKGRLWSDLLSNERLDRITVVAELDNAETTGAIELRAAVDPDGEATTIGSIALDGTPTSFTLGARTRVDLYCTGAQADQGVELRVYRVQSPQMMGVDELELPDTLAYTDQAQQWAFLQQFDNFNISGSGSGRTRITSSATAGEVVDLPALSGEIPILTDLSPLAGEYMRRHGSGGYESTGILHAEDGSEASPSIAFDSDDDNGFYRIGSDNWAASVGGTGVLFFGTAGGGLFTTLVFTASLVSINATTSWLSSVPDFIIVNPSTSLGAALSLREASTNGTSDVTIKAPASLAASYDLELFDAIPPSGHGVLFGSAGKMKSSPWASAVAIGFEESSNLSTSTAAGFQWSLGNGDLGDGYGAVIPFDYEIIGISASAESNPSGSATIEVYAGADEATALSSTGVSVSLGTGERSNYTDATGSPVTGNKGDILAPKTTAVSGTVAGGRIVIWVRPR